MHIYRKCLLVTFETTASLQPLLFKEQTVDYRGINKSSHWTIETELLLFTIQLISFMCV